MDQSPAAAFRPTHFKAKMEAAQTAAHERAERHDAPYNPNSFTRSSNRPPTPAIVAWP